MYRNMNTQMGYGNMGWGIPMGGYGYQGGIMPSMTPGYGYPGIGYGSPYGQNPIPGYMPATPGMTFGMGTPGYGMNNPGMTPDFEMPNYPVIPGNQPGLPYVVNNPSMLPGINPTTGVGKSGYFGTMEDLDDQDIDFQPKNQNFGYPNGFPYGY
ncbi:hypothetical protein RZN22_04530 [Bacillaceae bacterium S4-13-58]